MAHANNVSAVYRSVVDDVINNVREAFLDEGCDEQILQELKQLWENKLAQSKTVEAAAPSHSEQLYAAYTTHQTMKQEKQATTSHVQPPTQQQVKPQAVPAQQQQIHIQQPQQAQQPQQPQLGAVQQQQQQQQQLPLVINAGGNALQLGGASQPAAVALPAGLYQQQLINNQLALQPGTIIQGQGGTQFIVQAPGQLVATQQQAATFAVAAQQPGAAHVTITQGGTPAARPFSQTDGANDSSSEDDDDDDRDDDDNDDDDEKDDENEEEQGEEEDPLNSDDDVSDADPSELFDTDNVVVCQYDKINRAKNRWKFHLKDGIMNLNGRDYVFQKANGEAEW